jgi:hypothetical protein
MTGVGENGGASAFVCFFFFSFFPFSFLTIKKYQKTHCATILTTKNITMITIKKATDERDL